jgi:two-component system cell cycle response regulator
MNDMGWLGRRRNDKTDEAGAVKVLIVSDGDPRADVATLLRGLGFSAMESRDLGVVGQLTKERFDVVLVALPAADAVALIQDIRADERTSATHAVHLGDTDDQVQTFRALCAGYDDVVSSKAPDLSLGAKMVAAVRASRRQHAFESAMQELVGMATHDELTGLFNRRLLLAEADRLLAERGGVALVVFDLDDFKQINDTYGHVAGDQVLRDVGALFTRCTRPEDLIARYGGDEFVLLITDADMPHVTHIVERLTNAIHNLQWRAGETSFGVQVTTGVASTESTTTRLLESADRDLYRNKNLRKHVPDIPTRGTDVVITLVPTREVEPATATPPLPRGVRLPLRYT